MKKRRKATVALLAALTIGLVSAGMAGSAGSPTNGSLAEQGAPTQQRPGATQLTNDDVVARDGVSSQTTAPSAATNGD